jgi:hypothetical protein
VDKAGFSKGFSPPPRLDKQEQTRYIVSSTLPNESVAGCGGEASAA